VNSRVTVWSGVTYAESALVPGLSHDVVDKAAGRVAKAIGEALRNGARRRGAA